jgi:hypothetical protein
MTLPPPGRRDRGGYRHRQAVHLLVAGLSWSGQFLLKGLEARASATIGYRPGADARRAQGPAERE